MTKLEAAALAANAEFYAAFRQRDVERMLSLWALHLGPVCIHPGWEILRGGDAVADGWRTVLAHPDSPEIRCFGASVLVVGKTAIVTCTEEVPGLLLAATNVFVRENRAWKLVLHQAGPFQASERAPLVVDPKGLN